MTLRPALIWAALLAAMLTAGLPAQAMPSARPSRVEPTPDKLVDLNSASIAELKTLPGIGDAEAEKIIAQRPYLTKTELVSKGVLPAGPYVSVKNKVVAMPKGMAEKLRQRRARTAAAAGRAKAASAAEVR